MSDLEPLIHVGYHKTGTTWLQRRVFTDAKLGFSSVTPPRLVNEAFVDHGPFSFDAASTRELLRSSVEASERDGTTLVISQERLSGDPMQGSLDARSIADRLVESIPGESARSALDMTHAGDDRERSLAHSRGIDGHDRLAPRPNERRRDAAQVPGAVIGDHDPHGGVRSGHGLVPDTRTSPFPTCPFPTETGTVVTLRPWSTGSRYHRSCTRLAEHARAP